MALETKTKYKITDKDIDAQGHLNNARAFLYTDKARIKLQEKVGLKESELVEKGIMFVVNKSNCNFKKQIMPDSTLEIHFYFKPYAGGAKFQIVHEMYVNKELAVLTKTEHVFVKDNKPIKPLEEFIKKFY